MGAHAPLGDSPTDFDLASAIMQATSGRAGPAEAELFRRFAPRVRLYGRRHLRDDSLADDLTQRCLHTTIEKLRSGSVKSPEKIGSFILGVARLQSREMLRKRNRESPTDQTLALDVVAPSSGEPEPMALDRLRSCLAALTERERSVVALSYYEDQTAEQIADSWNLSPGNVRVIRHRAIDRLRRCMGVEEGKQ